MATRPNRKVSLLLASLSIIFVLLACNIPFSGDGPAQVVPTEEPIPTTELDQLEQSQPAPVSLQVGEEILLLESQVGPEGGSLPVSDPGTTLDGLTVVIPPGAYSENVSFRISRASIDTHNLQPGLNPITPLLIIENGGVEAADFLELHLPLQLSAGKFAMLFIYDSESGVLDGLPLIEEDNAHLVAITKHFSRIFGIEVDTAELDALNIQTGFRHGWNSWQMANYGSFIQPDGHCAGQSVAAMDFYMRSGGEKLFGTYDNYDNPTLATPENQDDDRLATRLVSMVQDGMDWNSYSRLWWYKVQDEASTLLTYYSLSLALRANNEPQYVAIRSEDGGGHALVLYGKYADRFYVSDPNYPRRNEVRVIVFNRNTGKFEPYYSGPNAADLGKAFPFIRYLNKYGLISPQKLNAYWDAFANGTIGNGIFPEYELKSSDPANIGLASTIVVAYQNYVRSTPFQLDVFSVETVKFDIFDKGNVQVYSGGADTTTLPLTDPSGTRYLVVVYGWKNGDWQWIDGRWFNFMQSFDGTWRGPACGENESDSFRWQLNITQGNSDTVFGDVNFHACPGGGAVGYSLNGKYIPGENTVTLTGMKSGGRGDLGENAADTVVFTLDRNGQISPNFAP